jgi:FlaA1/EpsC-like NDP-sugar epimerase
MPILTGKQQSLSDRIWFLRRPVQFLLDIAVLTAAFFLAYLPAINIQVSDFYADIALRQLPLVILIQFSTLFLVGAYSILWRYVSIEDLKAFLASALISGAILLALRFLLTFTDLSLWQVPISVIMIDTVLGFVACSG